MESKSSGRIPKEILYDLISRFIINIPEDERKNIVRICFQIEIAHWFYLDFYCTEENPHLRSCTMKDFTALVFKHIPDMEHHLKNLDAILTEWREYKRAVPTYGAIVLDKDLTHVLLVQSFLAKSSWGFPKGKVNEEEPPLKCAVREVFEETGFDISNLVDEQEYIEITWNEQVTRLYLVPGVDRSTVFRPRTRMEIKAVEWFPLADLPTERKKASKDATPKVKKGPNNPNNFFMVLPFVKRIRSWVSQKQNRRQRHKSVNDTDILVGNRIKFVSDVESQHQLSHQHQLSSASQVDTQDFKMMRQQRAGSTGPTSGSQSAPRLQINGRKEKPPFKRQLFTNDEENKVQNTRPQQNGKGRNTRENNVPTPVKNKQYPFLARAWTNFKFDKGPLMAAIDFKLTPTAQAVRIK